QAGGRGGSFGERCSTSLCMGAGFVGHAWNLCAETGDIARCMQKCIPRYVPTVYLSMENK
ncbi:hypothetical protein, partial [Pseudomonas syringae]|uniref:hypothetical protein n=1 Tax=Pseudomonas syringae TaxID=317 RepID=UPI001E5A37CC